MVNSDVVSVDLHTQYAFVTLGLNNGNAFFFVENTGGRSSFCEFSSLSVSLHVDIWKSKEESKKFGKFANQ